MPMEIKMIEPKVLKGFRDSLPSQEIVRQNLISKVQSIFRSFGFVPIDTPAIEYSEVLLGKGGGETDKQMYRFSDNGERDVALRFDLTVPLARFVSANYSELSFPFKRYHIAKVWRGEKPQKGRFREFWQCDFDIIGADNAQSDFEILLLIHTCLSQMNVGSFKVMVSHRSLLNRFLSNIGISDKSNDVLRAIDKLAKIGSDGVVECLIQAGISDQNIGSIMEFINLPKKSFAETLSILKDKFGDSDEIIRLQTLLSMMKQCQIEDSFILDTSITRGLDYYTGIVYETVLTQLPQIGSICSGGRYNNLTALYSKESLPGVGSCIGLDRLIAALEETGNAVITNTKFADVMILNSEQTKSFAFPLSMKLRQLGISTEVFLGDKNSGKQFAYAQDNKIKYVICSNNDGKYQVKDISTRQMIEVSDLSELAILIK